VVEGTVAAGQPLVTNETVVDFLKFKKAFLQKLRPQLQSQVRDEWRRFVLVRVDQHEGMSMYPRLLPNAMVLIDRHYNSLEPYRKNEQNMYAVRAEGGITVKYVEQVGKTLVLRPQNPAYPVGVINMEEEKTLADYVVGRVAHVAIET
jgi:phage repressor protein C with HTH and peptisase S24 domain